MKKRIPAVSSSATWIHNSLVFIVTYKIESKEISFVQIADVSMYCEMLKNILLCLEVRMDVNEVNSTLF